MHENLKTTLSLKKEDNDSNVKDNWQMLVPDYQYGTFFVLYGRLRGITIDEKFFEPKKCDLFLQNYQGNITIGLNDNEEKTIEIDIVYDELLKKPVYLLLIKVKALHANEKIENYTLKIKDSNDLSIKMHKDYQSKSEFKDLTTSPIDSSYELRIEIVFENLAKTHFDENNLNKSVLIDDVNFSRDGDQVFGKNYNLYDVEKKVFLKEEGSRTLGDFENTGTINDNRCNPKYAKMFL